GNEVLADTGLQGMNPGGLEGSGFPAMNIDNVRALSVAVAGGVKNHDHTFSFEDNVTWTKRNHSFKFGGDLTQFKTFSGEVPNYGSLNFNGFASGIPYADFLLGIPSRSTRNSPRINRERSIKEIGLYATDSFKVTPSLTLDLGLRWDYYGPATYKDGLQYNFDPETGNVIIPNGTRGEVDPLYPSAINIVEGQVVPKADKGNFRPRIAVAYRFGDDFVLRGGYGAFTERFSRFYTDFALGGGPFSRFSEAYDNSIVNGVPLFSFPNPFPPNQAGRRPAGAQSVAGVPLKSDDGVIHQFNISLEKEIFGLGLRGSYIGSRGTGLRAWTQLNARRPGTNINSPIPKLYPQFATGIALGGGASGVNYVRDDFGSSYDSVQVEVQRRKGEFTFDAHYTYAIDKDNINKTPNPFEPTSVWARNDVTRKHLAVVTTTWHLPVGKGKRFLSDANSAIDTILGGWKLQTVSYFGSGKYFTPYDCGHNQTLYGSFDGIYGGGCIRPDAVSDGNLPRDERTVNRWFDYTAFATPSPGTYGNAKTNSLVGPGLHVHHLSLAKTFAFSERFRLTYTASISNIFNTPNFYQPDGDLYCAEGDYCGATLYYTLGVGGGAPENGGHRTVAMKLKFDF
ncbi:MAG TPA: hypothetical protein VGQ55_02625, partial [Pyrinomonadaceae bacterium]|nr:hypothetical protein [Pyrinomonadaceae bacterium]